MFKLNEKYCYPHGGKIDKMTGYDNHLKKRKGGNENVQPILFCYGARVCLRQKEDNRWAICWILTPGMVSKIDRRDEF